LDEIQTKVLRVSLTLLFTSTPLSSHLYSFVKEKGGKPDRKPYLFPYGLRNPYRNLKFENFQDYA
jgi:hypothetical protein